MFFLIMGLVVCSNVFAKSFLKATSFPTTFADIPFVKRIAVLKEGFEPYESEYNDKGVCIKNCPYPGLTIKQELEQAEYNTINAWRDAMWYAENIDNKPATPYTDSSKDTSTLNYSKCVSRHPYLKQGHTLLNNEPVLNQPAISSPFGERIHPITNKLSVHQGIDYAVPERTIVYVPADGMIVKTWYQDSGCGNGVKIRHRDGMYTKYCHLQEVFVNEGDFVPAGCGFAYSGNTGRSTGPHLHYAVSDKNDKPVNPSRFTGR